MNDISWIEAAFSFVINERRVRTIRNDFIFFLQIRRHQKRRPLRSKKYSFVLHCVFRRDNGTKKEEKKHFYFSMLDKKGRFHLRGKKFLNVALGFSCWSFKAFSQFKIIVPHGTKTCLSRNVEQRYLFVDFWLTFAFMCLLQHLNVCKQF